MEYTQGGPGQLNRSLGNLKACSNWKHNLHLQGNFYELLSLHTSIIWFWFVKIKCRYHSTEDVYVLKIHLYCLSSESFKFELSEKVRSEFGTIRNSHSSLIHSLWYLYGWIRVTKWSNFHVYIFANGWEMIKLQILWLEVEDEV